MLAAERLLRTLVRTVVLGLALLPALMYGLAVVLEVVHRVEYDAVIQSRRLSDFIALNPDGWLYLSERLRDQVSEFRHEDTRTLITTPDGDVIARMGEVCRWLCVTRSADLLDYGHPVGRLSVSQDMSGVLTRWVAAVLVSLALASLVLVLFERKLMGPLLASRRLNQQLRVLDPLTGLPNRRFVLEQLDLKLAAAIEHQAFGALVLIDVDQFNVVNDTEGHVLGDQVLHELAQRLLTATAPGDVVARFGGDEFVVVLQDLGSDASAAASKAEQWADALHYKLGLPYALAHQRHALHLTVSLGVALFGGRTGLTSDLIKEAEMALYEAKRGGRNTVRFFNAGIQSELESRAALIAALRRSIDLNEFELYYQPQCNERWEIIGAEALVRWHPHNGEVVSPGDFVSVAEESGLILPIGGLVMQKACLQIKAWEHTAWSEVPIAVNVSARQFEQADFVDQLRTILHLTGANPARLKLEVTESMVIRNLDAVVERMHQLRAMGVRFALDDFGTGYSSLSVIKRLPLQQIKIDQAFVRHVVTDPNDYAIVRAIIALAQALGLEVLAEGVESEEQREFLYSFGCRQYQGYLFGRPEPAEEWAAHR